MPNVILKPFSLFGPGFDCMQSDVGAGKHGIWVKQVDGRKLRLKKGGKGRSRECSIT
jgi:hypothetical protein